MSFFSVGPTFRSTEPPTASAALVLAPLALTLLLLAACQPGDGREPAAEEVLVNQALNLHLASVPETLRVETNQGSELVLAPADERSGRLWFEVGEPSEFGIDVVALANAQKDLFLAEPGGSFSGANKLIAHLGEAAYGRGQYDLDGQRVEETRIFAIHPADNRQLVLSYRYPAGDDSSARVTELLDVMARIETSGAIDGAPQAAEG